MQVDKDMSSHTIKEHKDKCFECDNCNKLFTSKCKLKNHMKYESMMEAMNLENNL
jgi:transcription elongation factor Elf1